MSYKTFLDLDPLTGAELNTYLMSQTVARFASVNERDAAIPGPAIGQVTYITGLGFQAYNGSTLWSPLPGTLMARMHRTTATTFGNGTAVLWDTEDYDIYNGHSTTTNTGRYTCPVGGWYQFSFNLRHQNVAVGTTLIAVLRKGGSEVGKMATAANGSGSTSEFIAMTDVLNLTYGDYIDVTLGNSLAAAVNGANSLMTVTYAGV